MTNKTFYLVKNISLSNMLETRCFASCSKPHCIACFTEYTYATRFAFNDAETAVAEIQKLYPDWEYEIVPTNEPIPQIEKGFYLTFITEKWRYCKVFSYPDKQSRDSWAKHQFNRQKRRTDSSNFYRETTQEDLNRLPIIESW